MRLVLAAGEGAEGHELDLRLDDKGAPEAVADRFGEARVHCALGGELDGDRERRLLLHALGGRLHEDVAADRGREGTDDLADRRREDVHATHDQHVVGAADAANPRARAAAGARAHAHLDVVAGTEAKERRRFVAEMGEHELAGRAVFEWQRGARFGIDQLGVYEAAGTEVHPVLRLALTPERDADVADPHRLGHRRAPALLEPGPERRLPAARLARDENALDARPAQVPPALGGPLDEIGRIRRGQHRGVGLQQLDRGDQALAVAGADRDVADADPVERLERAPATKGPAL